VLAAVAVVDPAVGAAAAMESRVAPGTHPQQVEIRLAQMMPLRYADLPADLAVVRPHDLPASNRVVHSLLAPPVLAGLRVPSLSGASAESAPAGAAALSVPVALLAEHPDAVFERRVGQERLACSRSAASFAREHLGRRFIVLRRHV